MNAERLLAHFETISEAPDAIARLRRFILDLAVRGKLVEQDPEDEPAEELLESITAEKRYLEKLGDIRASKKIPDPEEPPFGIPMAWAWTQLACIGSLSPRNLAPDSSSVSFVPMPLISSEYGVPNGHEVRTWGEIKKGYTHFAEGDVGLAKITPCFENGKSTVFRSLASGIGSGTTELHVIRPLQVSPDFILLFLKSPHFIQAGIPRMTGTAGQKRLPLDYFAHSPFPLPPLAEQHRIVAKVDELMALCDQLEAARQMRERGRERLVAATLQRLNEPDEDPASFRRDARFAIQVLPSLASTAAQIKKLRQTILNLAVRGKLVEQDPEDEPAEELLASFAEAKVEQKKRTGDARIKIEDDPYPDALPWALPAGWMCQSFQNLFLFIDYRGNTPPKTTDGVPLITAKNVRMGRLEREPQEFLSQNTFEKWMTRGFPRLGDIFFTTEAPLGNVCLNNIKVPFALAQRVICLQPYAAIDTRFIMFALMSNLMQAIIGEHATGLTAKGIKAARLKPLPVPLPPLAEQHRIVAKVDTLMALCDELEQQLNQADQQRSKLLEAVLAEALEEPEKALASLGSS